MPATPALDGLPLWLQVLVTIIFGAATLGVAFKGYKNAPSNATPVKSSDQANQILGATIMDNMTLRLLSDSVVHLTGAVVALQSSVDESTHFTRNQVEVLREVCGRLRDLADEMERQGREQRIRDNR